jgi:SH3 domain protein
MNQTQSHAVEPATEPTLLILNKAKINHIMTMHTIIARHIAKIILITLLGAGAQAAAETLYVSDELTVPIRSGATTQHRILGFLGSGTALDVQETSDDGEFYRVNAAGKEGWVKAEFSMKSPSARSQLPRLNQRIESLKADIKQEKATIAELNAKIRQLEADSRSLEKNRDGLSDSLEKLKQVAARPVAIAQQNKELEQQLNKVTSELTVLQEENEHLGDRNIKEWFLIGGGVSLASLLFGLVIPNIKWRRKRDSWGSGF